MKLVRLKVNCIAEKTLPYIFDVSRRDAHFADCTKLSDKLETTVRNAIPGITRIRLGYGMEGMPECVEFLVNDNNQTLTSLKIGMNLIPEFQVSVEDIPVHVSVKFEKLGYNTK